MNYDLVKKGNISSSSEMSELIPNAVGGDCYLITENFTYDYGNGNLVKYTKSEVVYWEVSEHEFRQFTLPISEMFTKNDAEEFNRNFQAWAIRWFSNLASEVRIKLPKIVDNKWYLYDYDLEQYVDSGYSSAGTPGPQGPQGAPGPQGPSGSGGSGTGVIETFEGTCTLSQASNTAVNNFKLQFIKTSGNINLENKKFILNSSFQSISLSINMTSANNSLGNKYQDLEIKILDQNENVLSTIARHVDTSLPVDTININENLLSEPSGIYISVNCPEQFNFDWTYSFRVKILGFNERSLL